MDGPQPNWFDWILGVLMGLLAIFVRADKAKLERYFDQVRDDRSEMHRQNFEILGRIASETTEVRKRVDQLYDGRRR